MSCEVEGVSKKDWLGRRMGWKVGGVGEKDRYGKRIGWEEGGVCKKEKFLPHYFSNGVEIIK